MASQNFDVCVVGAGAAGAIVSYLLARKGWKVLLIEAGRQFDDSERYQKARDLINSPYAVVGFVMPEVVIGHPCSW